MKGTVGGGVWESVASCALHAACPIRQFAHMPFGQIERRRRQMFCLLLPQLDSLFTRHRLMHFPQLSPLASLFLPLFLSPSKHPL